jgi:subtilase family serine protease
MSRRIQNIPFYALFLLVPYHVPAQSTGDVPVLITQSVDSGQYVTLPGNVPPEAVKRNDRGAIAGNWPMTHLWIQLKRSSTQQAALDQYLRDLSDPTSARYHHWLTAQQFGERFGLAQADLDSVTEWLRSQNLTVEGTLPNRTAIVFSGTAQQVSSGFHTTIHSLAVDGKQAVSNMTNPQIPAALTPVVGGIVGLNNILPQPLIPQPALHRTAVPNPGLQPNLTAGDGNRYLTPQDLATIYDLDPAFQAGYTGQGQTIAVVEDSDVYSLSDWAQFRKFYGLTRPYVAGSLQQVHPSTAALTCNDPGVTAAVIEATIDAQWASAAAPNANILVASCADTSTQVGIFIAMQNLVNSANPPSIISVSYQEAENQLGDSRNAYINSLYEQAAAEGISVFAATGDSGADSNTIDRAIDDAINGINANGLSSTPYNVAVGGTDYQDTYLGQLDNFWNTTNTPFGGSAKSYIPEIPWNDSCGSSLFSSFQGFATPFGPNGFCNSSKASQLGVLGIVAAGGAPSSVYSKPSWQTVFGNPDDAVRDLPDLSLFAANAPWGHAYTFCYSGQGDTCAKGSFYIDGGTSFAAPIMAGIQALVNQKTGSRQGNPNAIYYALAAGEYGSNGASSCDSSRGTGIGSQCVFHDITQGDIDVLCQGTLNCFTDRANIGVLSLSNSSYQPAYAAHSGWDFATGLGTVDVFRLLTRWPISTRAVGP